MNNVNQNITDNKKSISKITIAIITYFAIITTCAIGQAFILPDYDTEQNKLIRLLAYYLIGTVPSISVAIIALLFVKKMPRCWLKNIIIVVCIGMIAVPFLQPTQEDSEFVVSGEQLYVYEAIYLLSTDLINNETIEVKIQASDLRIEHLGIPVKEGSYTEANYYHLTIDNQGKTPISLKAFMRASNLLGEQPLIDEEHVVTLYKNSKVLCTIDNMSLIQYANIQNEKTKEENTYKLSWTENRKIQIEQKLYSNQYSSSELADMCQIEYWIDGVCKGGFGIDGEHGILKACYLDGEYEVYIVKKGFNGGRVSNILKYRRTGNVFEIIE